MGRTHAALRTLRTFATRQWFLTFVLTLNPEHLTIPDLARSLNTEPGDFKRPDAVERAVRDLVGVGLIQIDGGQAQPTAAALRFIEIIEGGV